MLRLLLCLSLISLEALACTEPGRGFLPTNNQKYPVNFKTTGLTREQYDSAIDKVLKIYSPIARLYGARIQVERLWESETVNAGTLNRNEGKTWVINLYGGFARHPSITPDGYMLVICHEIGHHIGGAPKKKLNSGDLHWSSTEGQSDYFANLKCLRKVFANDNNEEVIRSMDIPEKLRNECKSSFSSPPDAAICIRTTMAGISVGNVNADIRKLPPPDLDTEDSNIATSTFDNHPLPQCRMDTYFQASLCPVPAFKVVSQIDEVKGTCHESLNYTVGLRPACWYKPQ